MHLLLLALFACGDKDDPGGGESGSLDSDDSDAGAEQTTVGPDGGTLRSADGVFELYIPPQALSGDVDFTVETVPDDGPLGKGYLVLPSIELAVDGTATFTVGLSQTSLSTQAGIEVPVLALNQDGDVVTLQSEAELDDTVVVRSAVPRVGPVSLLGSDVTLLARVFPGSDAALTRFDLKAGQSASTTVQVTYEGATNVVEVTVEAAAQGLDVDVLSASPPQELGRVQSGASVAPALFACSAPSDDASVTHSLRIVSSRAGETSVKLAVRGDCRDAETPAVTDIGGVVVGAGGDKALLVSDGALVEYDVDDGTKAELLKLADLNAAQVDYARVYAPDRALLRTTDAQGQVQLERVDLATGDSAALDLGTDGTLGPWDLRAVQGLPGTAELQLLLGSDASGRAELYTVDENGLLLSFAGWDTDRAAAGRVSDRRGDSGALLVTDDAVEHAGPAGRTTVGEGGGAGAFCGDDGACVVPGTDALTGYLWGGALNPAEPSGAVPFTALDQMFHGPGRWGSRSTQPLTADGGDSVGLASTLDGHPVLTTEPLPGDCVDPDRVFGLDLGRVLADCGDGKVVVTDALEVDLDALSDCETDLWESYDPHPGIPIAPSGTSGMIGGADAQDRFHQIVDVPADCESGAVTVLIDFGNPTEIPTVSGTSQTLEVNPFSEKPQAALFFPVDAGTSAPIDFTLEQGGACVDYVVTSELVCGSITLDASEPNDSDADADLIELGDGEQIVLNDLSLGRGDVDWFLLELEGECDVTATATDNASALDSNQLILQGHGELAITALGTAAGGPAGEQTLTYRGLGTGKHWVQVSAPTWVYDDYSLALSADCPFGCYTDVYEPNSTFETRDRYNEKYLGSVFGETMTVSDSDHDWFEIPVAVFGCFDDPDMQFTVTVLDGDPGATLHMNLTDKGGSSWVSDRTMTTETFLAEDVLGPFPYSTDLYVEWWAEGGCLEFSVEYTFICQ